MIGHPLPLTSHLRLRVGVTGVTGDWTSSPLDLSFKLRVGVTGDWTSYGYLRTGVTGLGNWSELVPLPVTPVNPVTLVTSHSGYQLLRLPVTLVTSHSGYQSLQLPDTPVTSHCGYSEYENCFYHHAQIGNIWSHW